MPVLIPLKVPILYSEGLKKISTKTCSGSSMYTFIGCPLLAYHSSPTVLKLHNFSKLIWDSVYRI